jgi:hypothetical protein
MSGMQPRRLLGSPGTGRVAMRLEKITYGCVQRDACARNHTDNVGDLVSQSIVSIQREPAGVVFPIRAQCYLLKDTNWTGRVPDSARRVGRVIGQPGEVVQLVLVYCGLFPHAHAEVAILRRTSGIHELSAITVPRD